MLNGLQNCAKVLIIRSYTVNVWCAVGMRVCLDCAAVAVSISRSRARSLSVFHSRFIGSTRAREPHSR